MPESVSVVPYDAEWVGRFEGERALLHIVFAGTDPPIERVGSTPVPGLGAKPVIDIMVGFPPLFISSSARFSVQGWRAVSGKQLEKVYPEFRIKPPADFPWGREVNFIDLAGVCWHVSAD